MVYDINPSFGRDERYENSARKVADFLWETSKGDLQSIPDNYVKELGHDYADGSVSRLNLLNRVSLSEGTYEEFSEVVDSLMYTEAQDWPADDSILEVQAEKLLWEIEPDPVDFSEVDFEFDFASPRDMSEKMELFLKKTISSVYLDGVSRVTDKDGNPPNAANKYLMEEKGGFSGTFYDSEDKDNEKQFNFQIKQKSNGNWEISY